MNKLPNAVARKVVLGVSVALVLSCGWQTTGFASMNDKCINYGWMKSTESRSETQKAGSIVTTSQESGGVDLLKVAQATPRAEGASKDPVSNDD